MSLTHRAACNRVAEYLMRTIRWCDLAVVEVAGRRTGELPPRPLHTMEDWRDDPDECRRKSSDYYAAERVFHSSPASGGGQLDVLALTLPEWKPRRKVRPRIAIVEVKVSRSDLLSDLRAGKLLRYEPQATHVYLAITGEAMLTPYGHTKAHAAAWLADLAAKGLPTHWGVLRIPGWPHETVHSLRQPGRNPHACDPTPELRTRLAVKAAVSMAYKMASQ